jgi:hypothetical protein
MKKQDKPIEISSPMVERYLSIITVGWFDNATLPADDVSEYIWYADGIKREAEAAGDLPYLRLALGYLLNADDSVIEAFAGPRYPYDADELREIITFLLAHIWPDSEPQPASVQLSKIPWEMWQQSRPQSTS